MIKLEPLAGHHNRRRFDCGIEPLNAWLSQTALQHQGKGISRTFVATAADELCAEQYQKSGYTDIDCASILGYYALAAAVVMIDDLPPEFSKRYPRQIPVTRLGRLAIRTDLQGQGLGKILLMDAIVRTRHAAQAVGSAGLMVDAKGDDAARFYQHYGFRTCADQPLTLFLSIW